MLTKKKNHPKSRPLEKYWIGLIRSSRRGRAALQFRWFDRPFVIGTKQIRWLVSTMFHLLVCLSPSMSLSLYFSPLSLSLPHTHTNYIYNNVVLTCTGARGRCFVLPLQGDRGTRRCRPMVYTLNRVRNFFIIRIYNAVFHIILYVGDSLRGVNVYDKRKPL